MGFDVLNRLWFKHVNAEGRYPDDFVSAVPKLTNKNFQITKESKTTEELYVLAGPGRREKPYKDDTPVVIVRFRGRDCLIDGGSRCRKWHNERDVNMHEAYVLTVAE